MGKPRMAAVLQRASYSYLQMMMINTIDIVDVANKDIISFGFRISALEGVIITNTKFIRDYLSYRCHYHSFCPTWNALRSPATPRALIVLQANNDTENST